MAVLNTSKHNHTEKMCFFDGELGMQRYDTLKYRAFDKLTDKQLGFFWRPEEVDILKDSKDFKELTDNERHVFTSNLKRQILLDSVQGRAPAEAFNPITSLPELENWITTWTFSETIHSRSYTHIIRNVYSDPSKIFDEMMDVQEIVDCLKSPSKYTVLGGKIPKGALLVGPPGTGKTLLAKAVAGEAKVPFFSLSGSDFVEMFVGVGASRVRDLFKQAKDKSPAIIFIDEIDAIGRARGKSNMTGSNDERENTLNQLLTEMDGFGTDTNVIVLAATNRSDVLDKALMRAGRFDRQIYVDLPDLREREEIFKVHLNPLKVDKQLDVSFLAKQTPGFSGADIANVCNESALIAARKSKKKVDRQDFLDAVDRIVGGLEKKSKIITPSEKKTIAFHEAGHATVSWMLEHAAPLVKVTIVPRGQSLGAAWYLPEERQIVRTEQMLDEMCATLGGRAAEQIIFGKISTGALSDLVKVTRQARAIVTVYGLNDKIGNITYYDANGQNEFGFTKPYSEETAKQID